MWKKHLNYCIVLPLCWLALWHYIYSVHRYKHDDSETLNDLVIFTATDGFNTADGVLRVKVRRKESVVINCDIWQESMKSDAQHWTGIWFRQTYCQIHSLIFCSNLTLQCSKYFSEGFSSMCFNYNIFTTQELTLWANGLMKHFCFMLIFLSDYLIKIIINHSIFSPHLFHLKCIYIAHFSCFQWKSVSSSSHTVYGVIIGLYLQPPVSCLVCKVLFKPLTWSH